MKLTTIVAHISKKPFSLENSLFLCLGDIFYFLKHCHDPFAGSGGNGLCADYQLHKIT